MKEVINFLAEAKIFYLATTEGDQPRVRAMGFFMEYEGKLSFCTSNEKKMYKQLVANPNVEICCIDSKLNTLRITGKVFFNTSEQSQRKALEVMPELKNFYAVNDGKFEIFYLTEAQAICQSMSGEKQSFVI